MFFIKYLLRLNVVVFAFTFNTVVFCGQEAYIFGESHANASFAGPSKLVTHIFTFPGFTMHRVGRDGLKAIDVRIYGAKENDFVVFVFGEIDVRNHIARQIYIHNRKLEEIIDVLVNNYINTILTNSSFYKKLYSIILSVVPPTHQGCNEFNHYGSIEERITFAKKLNEKLSVEAQKQGILFLNVYDYYATPAGNLKSELSDGNVHINSDHNAYIKDSFMDLIAGFLIKHEPGSRMPLMFE